MSLTIYGVRDVRGPIDPTSLDALLTLQTHFRAEFSPSSVPTQGGSNPVHELAETWIPSARWFATQTQAVPGGHAVESSVSQRLDALTDGLHQTQVHPCRTDQQCNRSNQANLGKTQDLRSMRVIQPRSYRCPCLHCPCWHRKAINPVSCELCPELCPNPSFLGLYILQPHPRNYIDE